MVLFAFDHTTNKLVMIGQRGDFYALFELKVVDVKRIDETGRRVHRRYVFSEEPFKLCSDNPYENNGITDNPDKFFDEVKHWHSDKIRYQ